jgi:hypothetical protein
LSLDEQLADLLLREKICADPDNFKPKCINCNGDQMVYVPAVCIRYVRHQMAFKKSIDTVGVEDLLKLQTELEQVKPRTDVKYDFSIVCVDDKLVANLPDAVVYLE